MYEDIKQLSVIAKLKILQIPGNYLATDACLGNFTVIQYIAGLAVSKNGIRCKSLLRDARMVFRQLLNVIIRSKISSHCDTRMEMH